MSSCLKSIDFTDKRCCCIFFEFTEWKKTFEGTEVQTYISSVIHKIEFALLIHFFSQNI